VTTLAFRGMNAPAIRREALRVLGADGAGSPPRGMPRAGSLGRAVSVAPVAYSTYAPRGYTGGDCKSLIGSGVRIVRLADDHVSDGRASADYRHLTCFYPKGRPSKVRGKVTP